MKISFSESLELMNHPQQDFSVTSGKKILVVDDALVNLHLVKTLLSKQGYLVRCTLNGVMALKSILADPPDLILLDINMSPMDGYEVSQCLKANPATRHIPIIFLSALDESFNKVQAFAVGGADYITKPFKIAEMVARIEHQLKLQTAQAEIRRLNTKLKQQVLEQTVELETTSQTLRQEIEQHQCTQQQLNYLALHDPLTQLPNRTFFLQHLSRTFEASREASGEQFALLSLDCDRFKLINESLGHHTGDQVLTMMAHRLQSCLSPNGALLARLEGDEFSILLKSVPTPKDAIALAHQLQQAMALPFQIEQHTIFVTVSIGIVLSTPHYQHPEHLLRDADTAMYRAKASAQANYEVFNPEMHARVKTRLKIETALRRALDDQQLVVYYQPIVAMETGKVKGFEALLRWYHPELGEVSPEQFIPVAEEIGLIDDIGTWVLRTACHQLMQWQQQSPLYADLTMSVNLSGKQLAHPDLLHHIDQILEETKLAGYALNLEITESVLMDQVTSAAWIIKQLRKRQIRLSIDDFGTGYSSMIYLQNFRFETLKIDRSFISGIHQTGKSLEIVKAMVELGHNLGMAVVAEGVETAQQLIQLEGLACPLVQGYWFSRPLKAQAIHQFVMAHSTHGQQGPAGA